MKYTIFTEEKLLGKVINNGDINGYMVIKAKKLGYLSKFIEGFKADAPIYRVDVKPTNEERFVKYWFIDRGLNLV